MEDCDWSDYPSGMLGDRITIKPRSCMTACRRSCAVTLIAFLKVDRWADWVFFW